ncbi:DNA methyltransferase [Microbacterium sp. NPDC007973]|uniref:DNA methyltransferase n=1 Tax=Microbacterium sp. NPDC007973 TaxID=3364182 RepID=UPI0036E3D2F5
MIAPHYEDAGLRLWHGFNLDILRADALGYPHAFGYHPDRLIPDGTYDSIVTDPPYELGFMGKGWDSSGIAYDVDVWRECLRVLKPGGHLLAFGGSRTWHRMAVAIEDAGFEMRDSIAWLYGSGFPKSMNVAAAIDKTGGASPETQARTLRAARERAGMSREDVAAAVGCSAASVGNWEDGRARAKGRAVEFITPGPEYRDALANLLGYSVDERAIIGATDDRRGDGTVIGLGHSGKEYGPAATDAAREWEGWGTALKPAFEPIVVARKPLRGTVAANVLMHGTGALNIDANRTPATDSQLAEKYASVQKAGARQNSVYGTDERSREGSAPHEGGRWPTNVLLDGSQAAALDLQSGVTKSRSGGLSTKALGVLNDDAWVARDVPRTGHDDEGGASRFFPTFRYEAKAPTSERPNVEGTVHATVKPLALIRWLVRLVTRPGGRVLDLYAGSGTTGEAALLEGMEVDLIELEEAHLPLILARVRKPLHPGLFGDWEETA